MLDFDAVSNGSPETQDALHCRDRNPAPSFCDDFDYVPIGQNWTDLEPPKNGEAKVVGDIFVTAPNSLLSTAGPVPTPTDNVRAVVKTSFPMFTNAKKKLTIGFDLYVVAFDPKQGARTIAFALLYGDVNKFYELVLNLNSNGTNASALVNEYNFPENLSELHASVGLLNARWIPVSIELTVNNPGGTGNGIAVVVDGKVVSADGDQLKLPLIAATPRMELGLGWMDTSKATGAWAIRYDNFFADWAPLP
jgi:hypothetical protein